RIPRGLHHLRVGLRDLDRLPPPIRVDIYRRRRLALYDYYKDGFRTLHGHSSRGFPNWFYIGIGQNGLSVNMTAMFDDQARHIAYIVKEARARGATTVEPTAEAEEAWVEVIRSVAIANRDFQN